MENLSGLNEAVEINKETVETINAEYEKMTGESVPKPTGNQTGMADESFEAFVTDPNLILSDLKALCEKHELSITQILSDMGFNQTILKAFLINKPITEQIMVMNREFNIIIGKMGLASGEVEDGFSTLNMRSLLGETMPSSEWLELMDKQVLPYMAHFIKEGKIDKEWFLKNDASDFDPTESTAKVAREMMGLQHTLIDELTIATEGTETLISEIPEDLDVVQGDEEVLELTQGEETVLVTTEAAVAEAQDHLDHMGEIVVKGNDDACDPA